MLKSLFFVCLILIACGTPVENTDPPQQLISVDTKESLAPNLYVSSRGVVYLSWIEVVEDTMFSLRFSMLDNDTWSEPKEVASGTDWFVNWADIPSIVTYDDVHLTAHWLQMRSEGTYDYDIKISQSSDGGSSWSAPSVLHNDGIAAEHGFVTLEAIDSMQTRAVWLDGRNTKGATTDSHEDHGRGAMTLRSAIIGADGQKSDAAMLDDRICDCCQTDMIHTGQGPVIAYRNRSPKEVRDISIIRKNDDGWTESTTPYHDEWEIHGCPVNGPALAGGRGDLGLAWFTASEQQPKVRFAISSDNGQNFNPPYGVDNGNPIGRVDLVFWRGMYYVTWVEKVEDRTILRMRGYKNGEMTPPLDIVEMSPSRRSGFPIVVASEDRLVIAWTEVTDGTTRIRTMTMIPT